MTSRPQFTDQQSAAILTRGVSIALSAGAGCGKTFVLTQRFLAGLEPNTTGDTDLHQLVAITFTDRAAREMRDRIRAACQDRLQNCPADEVEHWLGILRGLDSARISTIHSFCTSLLRTQAVEAGLDPGFTVLERARAETLLRQVARDTLHNLIEQDDDDAVKFVVTFGLERAREILRKLTAQRFQIDFSAFAKFTPETLADDWRKRWQTEFVPKLVASFRDSSIVKRTLESIGSSPSKNDVMKERLAALGALLPSHSTWNDITGTLSDITENARIQGGGGKKDWVSEDVQEQFKITFQNLRTSVDKLQKRLEVQDADVIASAELTCRALRLTGKTANRYADAKKAQSVLDFDDLLLHARNLLRTNEHVRQRVAAGIRLLMVDEFQDTDPVQAELVRNLCGAALTRGRLFMVGDRKQSIYRFRRADPTVFAKMSDEIPASGRLPLHVNFRSQPAVLNFVNQLFAPAIESYEPLVAFNNVQQSPTPAVEFLFATFDADGADTSPTVSENASATNENGTSADDDVRPNAAALRARETDWIARRIAALLDDPTPRIRTKEKDDEGRPQLRRVERGDIVILFRALSNVQAYESALQRYELDYYLVGGKAFYAQQEVFDLLNLCRYLDDCDDLVGLVGVLRSPFFNLSDDAIHALAFHADGSGTASSSQIAERTSGRAPFSLHQTLYLVPPAFLPEVQQHRIRFAAEILSNLRERKDRIPLADLLTEAIERTGYDASILVEFLGSRKLANLRKLIEMARQFDQGNFFLLKDFVTWLQTSVLEETDEEFATTLPEAGNVIRLMSIHQSKGLEFPVVIVADIDRKGPPRSSDAVMHPELGPLVKSPEKFGQRIENLGLKMHGLGEDEADAQETIRLFYVACTRAADYLILSTGLDHEKQNRSPWFELVDSRFDIRTGLLKFDPLLGSSTSETAGRENVPDILVHSKPCDVKPAKSEHERRVPIGTIPESVDAAQPGEFPESARIFSRDRNDLPVISVSRLEEIDAELTGAARVHRPKSIRFDDDDEVVDTDQATSLGTIIHSVLERIDFSNPANWPDKLMTVVDQHPDKLSDEAVVQARTMLKRFFDSPIFVELANAKSIHREIDFLLPWPASNHLEHSPAENPDSSRSVPMIAGIIDLLVETESGWHILDYKTGDFPSKIPDAQSLAPYELQLGIYAHAVQQWFGDVPRELSLITFRPDVRKVNMLWSADRWKTIRARIDRAIDSLRQSN